MRAAMDPESYADHRVTSGACHVSGARFDEIERCRLSEGATSGHRGSGERYRVVVEAVSGRHEITQR